MQLQLPLIASLLTTALALPSLLPRGQSWAVRDFLRTCTNTACTYTFNIDTGSYTAACSLTDISDNAATHAFYDVPCDENSEWHISWGWDYQDNFTVMTVRDISSNTEAFFGYNSPNSAESYADAGPNAVQSA